MEGHCVPLPFPSPPLLFIGLCLENLPPKRQESNLSSTMPAFLALFLSSFPRVGLDEGGKCAEIGLVSSVLRAGGEGVHIAPLAV